MRPRAMQLGADPLAPPDLVGVMVLLDRSASMSSIKAPMKAAFGAFVAAQKGLKPDGMWLTLHQFDALGYDVLYDRVPLADVEGLTIRPRDNTTLRDALYRFGREAKAIVDDAADPTERLLLVIVTDGEENASTRHTWAQVRTLFADLQTDQCETIWLGTSAAILEAQDQLAVALAMPGATTTYTPTSAGTTYAAASLSASVTTMRASQRSLGHTAKMGSASFTNTHTEADLLELPQVTEWAKTLSNAANKP